MAKQRLHQISSWKYLFTSMRNLRNEGISSTIFLIAFYRTLRFNLKHTERWRKIIYLNEIKTFHFEMFCQTWDLYKLYLKNLLLRCKLYKTESMCCSWRLHCQIKRLTSVWVSVWNRSLNIPAFFFLAADRLTKSFFSNPDLRVVKTAPLATLISKRHRTSREKLVLSVRDLYTKFRNFWVTPRIMQYEQNILHIHVLHV